MKKPTQKEMKEYMELAPLAKRFEELKKYFKAYMEEENEKIYENGNYVMTIDTKERNAFDQTLFKTEHEKMYNDYKRKQQYKTVNVDHK